MPDTIDCTPPDYIMPGSKERPLLPLHPIGKDTKVAHVFKLAFPLFQGAALVDWYQTYV